MSRSKHTSSTTRWRQGVLILSLLALSCLALAAEAPETPTISVGRMIFCRSIKDREPQEPAETFPNTIEKVYCFTAILNAGDETHVVHKWYHEEKLMAEVQLKAKGEYWRTWSSKQMVAGWTGTWRVDIVSADGKILKSMSFKLLEPEEETPGEDQAEEPAEELEESAEEAQGG